MTKGIEGIWVDPIDGKAYKMEPFNLEFSKMTTINSTNHYHKVFVSNHIIKDFILFVTNTVSCPNNRFNGYFPTITGFLSTQYINLHGKIKVKKISPNHKPKTIWKGEAYELISGIIMDLSKPLRIYPGEIITVFLKSSWKIDYEKSKIEIKCLQCIEQKK